QDNRIVSETPENMLLRWMISTLYNFLRNVRQKALFLVFMHNKGGALTSESYNHYYVHPQSYIYNLCILVTRKIKWNLKAVASTKIEKHNYKYWIEGRSLQDNKDLVALPSF
ncbi:hypothetical protein ACJX0J_007463, partial [Zea mays]